MIIALLSSILVASLVTFVFGFLAGYQKGEQSITGQLKYALLREENSRMRLACINMRSRLKRANIAEPDLFSYAEDEV